MGDRQLVSSDAFVPITTMPSGNGQERSNMLGTWSGHLMPPPEPTTVWKWALTELDNWLPIPKGARVLCVQMQDATPTLWAAVNPDNPVVQCRFVLVPTGGTMPPEGEKYYVGTVQRNGAVFHVFSVQDEPW